jgi:imidazolonepropionase-like amidohydrolase
MQEAFAIAAGWLLDGTGGAVQTDVLLEVAQGRIVSLQSANATGRHRSPVVHLPQCTILPALVDCHVHLCMSGTSNAGVRRRQLSFSPTEAQAAIRRHLAEHLAHGIMALRDGGDFASHTLSFRKEGWEGECWPLQVKAAGHGWHAPGRYGRVIGRSPAAGESLAQAIGRGATGADHIKIVNSGLNSLTEFAKETPPQFSLEELREAVRTGHERGLPVMVHANGKVPVRWAVEAGCDSIEHGFFMGRDNLERMAERGTVWVPTAVTMKAYAEQPATGSRETDIARRILDQQLEQVGWAKELGVRIAVGTDSGSLGVHHGHSLREELRLLMDAGLTVQRAVACACHQGARLLGLEPEVGLLKPGAAATLIAVPGGPEGLPEALRALELVCLRGKLLDLEKQERESCES